MNHKMLVKYKGLLLSLLHVTCFKEFQVRDSIALEVNGPARSGFDSHVYQLLRLLHL